LFDSKRRPDVLRAAKHEVLSGGALGAMGAIGTAQGVYSAATGQRGPGDDPNMPVDRAGNLGAAVGNLAGMALPGFTLPIGMALQPAIGHAGRRAGSAIGRAVGSTTGKIPAMLGGQPTRHDPTDPVASGTPYYESTTSFSAAGQPYGGGISQ
jgi:hypothetical protein